MTDAIVPGRTAVLFLDFQVDVCAPGGRMVSQEPAVLERFAAARKAAGHVLDTLRRRDPRPHYLHVAHGWPRGYPALQGARLHGMQRYIQETGAFQQGEPGSAFVPELATRDGDAVLWKQTISAFSGTPLAAWLAQRGVDTVALAGVVTHYAVLGAALSAADLGYRTLVLSDCCASADPARHDTALGILGPLAEIVTGEEFLGLW